MTRPESAVREPLDPGRLGPLSKRTVKVGCLSAAGVVLLAALAVGFAVASARQRLQTSGKIIRTRLGPVEYSLHPPRHSSQLRLPEVGPVPTLPAVLLVHGTPGGNDQLQPLARRLAGGGLTVITFSRPGYLGTPITSGAGFDQQADLAAALLDTLEVSEVSVVGISGGGAVALQMTLRHPERVRALAMIAAVTFEPDGIGALADRPPDWQSDLRALRAMYWPDLALRRCGIDDPTERERLARDPGVRHRLRVLFRSLGFSRLTNDGYTNDYLQSELQNPRSYSLDQIEVPTLGIYGTDDTAVPPAHGERLAREIRGARLAVLPGAHAFFVLDEDAVIELLLPVLRSHVGDREHGPPGH